MYIVVKKDYINNRSAEIYKCPSLNEGHAKTEEFAREFVEKQEGQTNSKIFFKSEPKRGYYMKKSKNFNKISVYNKEVIKGIFANEVKQNKILSFQLVKIRNEPLQDIYNYFLEKIKKSKFFEGDCEEDDLNDIIEETKNLMNIDIDEHKKKMKELKIFEGIKQSIKIEEAKTETI